MKRISLLIVLCCISCGGLSSKQHEAAGAALASLQKVKAATEVGVNFNNYGQLLIDAKAKVNDATRVLPDNEMRKELNAAMDGYSDASQVWNSKIQSPGFFFDKTITDKYRIEALTTSANRYDQDTIMQIIWAEARSHLERAERLLAG